MFLSVSARTGGYPHGLERDHPAAAWTTDREWQLIEPLPPPPSPRGTDLREVFDAIRYMPGTGCRWRAIPRCFPPSATIRNHFCAWSRSGVFETMTDVLRAHARKPDGRPEEPMAAIIDSRTVKTTGSGPGRHRCRQEDQGQETSHRRRHGGIPVMIVVHTADLQDRDGALPVISGMPQKAPGVTGLRADGGYRGPEPAAGLGEIGLGDLLEIVKKPKDVEGFTVLVRRWVVERSFAWMGRCRRLARDFERSFASSLARARLAVCRSGRRLARGSSP